MFEEGSAISACSIATSPIVELEPLFLALGDRVGDASSTWLSTCDSCLEMSFQYASRIPVGGLPPSRKWATLKLGSAARTPALPARRSAIRHVAGSPVARGDHRGLADAGFDERVGIAGLRIGCCSWRCARPARCTGAGR